MRKIIFSFLFLFIAYYPYAQEIKKVAVLPPIDKENKVDYIYEHMFRTNMVKAISDAQGYICLNMDIVDEIVDVVQFQESGFVKDDEIQNLGMMQGANYICKSEITQKDSNLYISITITEIESGITLPGKTDDILTVFEADSIYKACQMLTSKLFKIEDKIRNSKSGTFIDARDNQIYNWVKIGEQIWMAENLNYKTTDSWCYDNDYSNCDKYGRLYELEVAKNACPVGWHLPSEFEWVELVNFIKSDGYSGQEEKALKSKSGWKNDKNGDDIYGFSALPSGAMTWGEEFYGLSEFVIFWGPTDKDSSNMWGYEIGNGISTVSHPYFNESIFSVRCIKD